MRPIDLEQQVTIWINDYTEPSQSATVKQKWIKSIWLPTHKRMTIIAITIALIAVAFISTLAMT